MKNDHSKFFMKTKKPYKPFQIFFNFFLSVKFVMEGINSKITMFAHFQEYHGNREKY